MAVQLSETKRPRMIWRGRQIANWTQHPPFFART
jgi:hypothetical protein